MYIIYIVGWKNSGKTTLVENLIPKLKAAGATVSTVKHTHHLIDLEKPGKDSFRHREAGAKEVAIVSSARWALLNENQDEEESQLERIFERMLPVDIVLVEGFKSEVHDKIEVRRQDTGGDVIALGDTSVVAVASDCDVKGVSVPRFDLNDFDAIVRFILDYAGLRNQDEDGGREE
jgi:molybdopterin-guanine dinucleotide biosynthesis protein MobB